MLKGDVWYVDLNGGVGSEQGGIRPCVIVQNDYRNKVAPTTIICPITSKAKICQNVHVFTDQLELPSHILCEQVRTISKDRLIKFVCHIDGFTMDEVDRKLKAVLGM